MNYKLTRNAHYWIVVKKVRYPSGDTAFWQQVSKNYTYKKSAENFLNKKLKGVV